MTVFRKPVGRLTVILLVIEEKNFNVKFCQKANGRLKVQPFGNALAKLVWYQGSHGFNQVVLICKMLTLIKKTLKCFVYHWLDIDPFPKRQRLVHNGGFPKFEALYYSLNMVNSTEIS